MPKPLLSQREAIIIACAFFTIIVPALGGLKFGYSVKSISLLASAGFMLGLIAAPTLEPKAFKYPILWQILFTTISFLILAFMLSAPPMGYALAVLAGIVLGPLAKYWVEWVRHI